MQVNWKQVLTKLRMFKFFETHNIVAKQQSSKISNGNKNIS